MALDLVSSPIVGSIDPLGKLSRPLLSDEQVIVGSHKGEVLEQPGLFVKYDGGPNLPVEVALPRSGQ